MMKANGNEEDINKIEGPKLFKELLIPTAIGAASLAGIIPLSGFFGKAAVDSAVTNIYVYAVLVLVDILSAVYIFRWMFIPLKRIGARGAYTHVPRTMLAPIYVLAALIVAASVIYFMLPSYLNVAPLGANYVHDAILLGTAAMGLLIAYVAFYKHALYSPLNLFYTRRITNRAYGAVVVLFRYTAIGIEAIDRAMYNFIKDGSIGIRLIGAKLSSIENGRIDYYLIAFITGLAVIIVVFMVL